MGKRFSVAISGVALLALPVSMAACGRAAPPPAKTPAAAKHEAPVDKTAKIRKWLAREVEPVALQRVDLMNGFATGEIESKTPVVPECKAAENGATVCTLVADLGQDPDDADAVSNVICSASTAVSALGPVLKASLESASLDETPALAVDTVGEGLATRFMANTTEPDGDNILVGTQKLATLYAHGYMVTCFDKRAGGRKTFERVTGHFFESLKFKSVVTVFAFGYRMRVGDRTAGVRYASIAKRQGDESGFVEQNTHFWLDTDGKTWSIKDRVSVAERDIKGAIQKMENLFWFEGQGPAVLSARPSEDKKFRLKYEVGDKSSGLESTPKAPLNTELWAAPELLKVSAGSARNYRYAFLDLIDSDPAFHYLTITRSAPGVLAEAQEAMPGPGAKDKSAADESKDELQIDARGLVTKEVSSHSVSELVYTWGDLPPLLSGAKTPAQKTGKRKSR
jgi:hypothetical protein